MSQEIPAAAPEPAPGPVPAARPGPSPSLVDGGSRPGGRMMLIGLAVAAVLGLGLAVTLSDHRKTAEAADPKAGLAIAVQPAPKPAPVAVAAAPGPLNALPEEAASLPANPPPQRVSLPAAPAADTPTRAAANPTFDCDGANNRAERMICADTGLAAADRRMDQAFQRALDAGVPFRVLQRQQRAWLRARNDAAFDGRDAVAAVYQDRIDELRQMARGD
ncbi:uncharacterized protein YecT (DUF1311 family) [Caulobacter ginsengisoli]|uniref:Uncharacterized protein YecT (DUF1311 family) n=1 Tax=Caulobacter ginsengisoli TaxID=400775 RepID=A0ABU0IW01_9CAUL|nr:lysozyme inhibitor LprI family protein [Caulobacter ginsengisoli]MDQ0466196.1 uncharacterized protein YecT (DUF1311 family) [Caulobacter ginsengisoli]